METLNLHLTGDFHAVTAAHNLAAAMVDNHLHHGNENRLDPRSIAWRRVLDVNDRALRNIVSGLGARIDGVPRQSGFDITAASGRGHPRPRPWLRDLRERLGRIVVGFTYAGRPVTAEDLRAAGAMAVILERPAAEPPADHREHAGPRAHRAVRQHRHRQLLGAGRPDRHPHRRLPADRGRFGRHGSRAVLQPQVPGLGRSRMPRCSSRSDRSRRTPATTRSWRAPAAGRDARGEPRGPGRHRQPAPASRSSAPSASPVVAVNAFPSDFESEHAVIREVAEAEGARVAVSTHVSDGGKGLASWPAVVSASGGDARLPAPYELDAPLGRRSRRSRPVSTEPTGWTCRRGRGPRSLRVLGYGAFPVVAKTHLSISSTRRCEVRPRWRLPVREVGPRRAPATSTPSAGRCARCPGCRAPGGRGHRPRRERRGRRALLTAPVHVPHTRGRPVCPLCPPVLAVLTARGPHRRAPDGSDGPCPAGRSGQRWVAGIGLVAIALSLALAAACVGGVERPPRARPPRSEDDPHGHRVPTCPRVPPASAPRPSTTPTGPAPSTSAPQARCASAGPGRAGVVRVSVATLWRTRTRPAQWTRRLRAPADIRGLGG